MTGTFHPHKHHVIFPRTGPAVIKCVYLRVLPMVWAIHLAKALDTMGFVIVVLCQHQDWFHCLSHQAAVPLILDLTECRLACVFQRPNKQSWTTTHFSHIWVWGLESWSKLPVVLRWNCEGHPYAKEAQLRFKWQELKASKRPCLPKTQLPNHVLKVSMFLSLEYFLYVEQYLLEAPV